MSSPRFLVAAAALALFAACSPETMDDDGGSSPPSQASPVWDDDAPRLVHCAFEPAPPRETKPPGDLAPLRAGYASAVLRMPIGVPLGGYGARLHALGGAEDVDDRAARWAKGMTPSIGLHDAPRAEAIALEAGGERVVLVRVDAPLVTENALFDLEAAIAPDGSLRGRIAIAASHSHAAWAAWQPTVHLMPGIDRPRRELYDRAIEAMKAAAAEALDALADARLGVAVDPAFDLDDRITTDRRNENDAVVGPDGNLAGADEDPVVWAMRIDRADGTPLAALVSLPIHGTVGEADNALASTDAPGAIARALSGELGYPVLHLQGAAGDVEPVVHEGRTACADALGCLDMPALEDLGARAAALVAPLVASIETEDRASIEMVTRTFPVGRGGVVKRPDGLELGYLPPDPERVPDGVLFDAAGRAASPFDEFNARSGAGLCGDAKGGSLAPIPGAVGLGPYASCIDLDEGAGIVLGLFDVDTPTLPLCDTARATGAALRIALPSAAWLVAFLPGEPTAPFAAYMRSRSPAGPERTLLVGYADEYAGYLLTAEDWLSGGYECSTNVWGPREGEQVLEQIVVAASLAWTPEREDPEAGTSRYLAFAFPDGEPTAAIATSDHGTAIDDSAALEGVLWPDTTSAPAPTQADEAVERATGAARFVWLGGDPAVDFPEVIVERELEPGGAFEPLADAWGRPASSWDGAVVVTYAPDPVASAAPPRHRWAATWQPVPPDPMRADDPTAPLSLATGRYRLRAKGRALAIGGAVEAYEVTSPAFAVVPAKLDPSASSVTTEPDGLLVRAWLDAAPGLRALRTGPSDVALPLPGPWQIAIAYADETTETLAAEPDADGTALVAPSGAAQVVSVEVRDAHGNGGVLVVPPP